LRRDDPEQLIAALDDESGIRHDDLEPRLRIVSESDAAIDDEPIAPVAVDIEVSSRSLPHRRGGTK